MRNPRPKRLRIGVNVTDVDGEPDVMTLHIPESKVNASIQTMHPLPGPVQDVKVDPHDLTTTTVIFQMNVVGLQFLNAQVKSAEEHIPGQAGNEPLLNQQQVYQECMEARN